MFCLWVSSTGRQCGWDRDLSPIVALMVMSRCRLPAPSSSCWINSCVFSTINSDKSMSALHHHDITSLSPCIITNSVIIIIIIIIMNVAIIITIMSDLVPQSEHFVLYVRKLCWKCSAVDILKIPWEIVVACCRHIHCSYIPLVCSSYTTVLSTSPPLLLY